MQFVQRLIWHATTVCRLMGVFSEQNVYMQLLRSRLSKKHFSVKRCIICLCDWVRYRWEAVAWSLQMPSACHSLLLHVEHVVRILLFSCSLTRNTMPSVRIVKRKKGFVADNAFRSFVHLEKILVEPRVRHEEVALVALRVTPAENERTSVNRAEEERSRRGRGTCVSTGETLRVTRRLPLTTHYTETRWTTNSAGDTNEQRPAQSKALRAI